MLSLKKKYFFILKKNFYKSLKNLFYKKKNSAGRNFTGQITVRSRGGGLKKKLIIIDYFRAFWNVASWIIYFKYDVNRKNLICLISYSLGLLSYVIAINNFKIGTFLLSGLNVPLKIGNHTILKRLKVNTKVSLLQNKIFEKAKFIRSTGCAGILLKKSKYYITVKLPSGALKKFNKFSCATIGSVLFFNYYLFRYKNAGFNRLMGFRPIVRGVAKNPVDHPYGGGEGKKSKKKISMSPWGKLIKGKKTRKK